MFAGTERLATSIDRCEETERHGPAVDLLQRLELGCGVRRGVLVRVQPQRHLVTGPQQILVLLAASSTRILSPQLCPAWQKLLATS